MDGSRSFGQLEVSLGILCRQVKKKVKIASRILVHNLMQQIFNLAKLSSRSSVS